MRRFVLLLATALGCRAPAIPESQRFPTGTPLSAREVLVQGRRIRYVETGRGTPVVMIHGLGASLYAWRKNLAPIAAAGFRVIAFDLPGFGFSGKTAPASGYDNESYVGATVALLDSLHIADAVLVGHSMGGAIAAQVAIDHPERVRGLVLIGSAGLGVRQPLVLRVARWPLLGPVALALRGRGLTGRILRATYADPGKVTEADVDQYYAPTVEPGYARALRRVLREFRFDGLQGQLEHVAAPTLVLWGEEDRIVPLGLGRALALGIPHAAFLSVPHAGHSVQEEAADEVNRLVIKFLREGLPRVPHDLAFGVSSAHISSTIWLRN